MHWYFDLALITYVQNRGCPSCGGGGGSTLYSGLYVEAQPERGTFFRPKIYERVVILLVEVYERVGCYSPLDGRVTPQQYVTGTHLYTWVIRDKVE